MIHWAHEQSGPGGRQGVGAWVQQHELPLIKADLVADAFERPTISKRDQGRALNPVLLFEEDNWPPFGKSTTLGTFHPEGQWFTLKRIGICSK